MSLLREIVGRIWIIIVYTVMLSIAIPIHIIISIKELIFGKEYE